MTGGCCSWVSLPTDPVPRSPINMRSRCYQQPSEIPLARKLSRPGQSRSPDQPSLNRATQNKTQQRHRTHNAMPTDKTSNLPQVSMYQYADSIFYLRRTLLRSDELGFRLTSSAYAEHPVSRHWPSNPIYLVSPPPLSRRTMMSGHACSLPRLPAS
ncbi:hypothetical protein LX32DRAFT_145991 [Colletotrichum zoysiae]|uniref:Uncharacterized protein n=1 Tax=Colletotrichum zoysiae TaxID=1216348 RepID=A0AAD9H7U2_9PEZI|nr:hypothetical protein LX32DRAFT_145991 [Colletotrichum zoysiae]